MSHGNDLKPTKEDCHRYYLTQAAKPEFKSTKSDYAKEAYRYRKSLGVCATAGCGNDAKVNRVSCQSCLDKQNAQNKAHRAKKRQEKIAKQASECPWGSLARGE